MKQDSGLKREFHVWDIMKNEHRLHKLGRVKAKEGYPEEPHTQDSVHSDWVAAITMCFAAAVVEKAAEVVGNVSAIKTENSC